MKERFYQFLASAVQAHSTPLPLMGVSCAALALFLFSCSSIPPGQPADSLAGEETELEAEHTILCSFPERALVRLRFCY